MFALLYTCIATKAVYIYILLCTYMNSIVALFLYRNAIMQRGRMIQALVEEDLLCNLKIKFITA